jgi:hypothetical protein
LTGFLGNVVVAQMQLPHPLARLADCCWLPRHVAKARLHLRGALPFSYRIAYGARTGVDGYFFRHFDLTKKQLSAAISNSPDDAAVARWFLQQPGVTPERIFEWNCFVPLLGTKGHTGYATLQIVKWFLYPKALKQPVASIVAAIVQDEGLPSAPRAPLS